MNTSSEYSNPVFPFTRLYTDDAYLKCEFRTQLSNKIYNYIEDRFSYCNHESAHIIQPRLFDFIDEYVDKYFEESPGLFLKIAHTWVLAVERKMSERAPERIIQKLKSCRLPCLISAPVQFDNLLVTPLLTVLDLYEEERRLYNDLSTSILSYLSGTFFVFSIRDEHGVSVAYFDVKLGDSGLYELNDKIGRNYKKITGPCIQAAERFVNFLNSGLVSEIKPNRHLSADKIARLEVFDKASDDSEDAFMQYCEYLAACYNLDEKLLDSTLRSTLEFRIEAVTEALGNELFKELVELTHKPFIEYVSTFNNNSNK